MQSILVATLILVSISFARAQADHNDQTPERAPTSVDPGTASRQQATKSTQRIEKSRIAQGPSIETQEQYVARMRRTVKQIRRKEKEMEKPQYSNPMYFGHKRPPKKHKAGHLKFCKECGIRH
jgi:hypothetical protein